MAKSGYDAYDVCRMTNANTYLASAKLHLFE